MSSGLTLQDIWKRIGDRRRGLQMGKHKLPAILAGCIFCLIITAHLSLAKSLSDLETGDVVYLGHYDKNGSNLENEAVPIEWVVLKRDDNKALLFSRNILSGMKYNETAEPTDWENCSLRACLNSRFLEACFTEEEKSAILFSQQDNQSEGNPSWISDCGANTTDYLFLLSVDQVRTFFSDPESGMEIKPGDDNGYEKWWLRSSGRAQDQAAMVVLEGGLPLIDSKKADFPECGVRPACWLDLNADSAVFPYERYQNAMKALEEGRYLDAKSGFESIPGDNLYNSSFYAVESAVREVFYYYGQNTDDPEYRKADGDFTELARNVFAEHADELFQMWKSFGGSMKESCYQTAMVLLKEGCYPGAVNLLRYVGVYKDSSELLVEARHGLRTYFFDDKTAKRSDSDKEITDRKDVHFGWRLGRFTISGFTEKIIEDEPVFLKNVGDEVLFSFDLEQDVDYLNRETGLSIIEDNDGFDKEMQIKRPEFGGRGTLIIRQTDYAGNIHKPLVFRNYLSNDPKAISNRDVILKEEGDYEIALDYKIGDANRTWPFDREWNYSIRFKFYIRNGNCAVFPIDIKTGSELSNESFTPDGFYLDMARSRYLKINVRRSVLAVNAFGNVGEDERYNRPARDGEQYTEEGIYTFTVYNEYTGESTQKRIFVGDKGLLDMYAQMKNTDGTAP